MDRIAYFEVQQKMSSTLPPDRLREFFKKPIKRVPTLIDKNIIVHDDEWTKSIGLPDELKAHIESIVCTTTNAEAIQDSKILLSDYETNFFVYKLSNDGAATETMHHDSEDLSVASHIILPAKQYEGLWESLYYESDLKNDLLNFVETTLLFSDKQVDSTIISWNKVILLHGPPGTGKTSLCKALAQKAAIRLCERYSYVELVEINSHSLFSKWFSESGKLVMKLFDEIRRLLENSEALVCVLIDEVESLAHARKSCVNGNEPSDAIRAVNALLTQIDQIKCYPNVMILTTSNVTEAIDVAFADRADIKQYIGNPGTRAIYQIYSSCLAELLRTQLLSDELLLNELLSDEYVQDCLEGGPSSLCEMSVGFSGRTLRKIPFLAYALFVQTRKCSIKTFLNAMRESIKKHKREEFLKV